MKSKITIMMMSLAIITVLSANAAGKPHRIRMKITGCLQTGTEPGTYALNNITKGYTRRNTTGKAPLMLARSEGFEFAAKGDVDDLRNHVGQRVTVTGWIPAEHAYTDNAAMNSGSSCSETALTEPEAGTSEFTISGVHRKSGGCQ
jgi:hypothetical protein